MKNQKGFTIVELLIVIVIIAILAAISVVAYSGIQQRARESRVMSQLSQARKSMEMYRIEHGKWPFEDAVAACIAGGDFANSCASREIYLYLIDNGLAGGSTGGNTGNTSSSYNTGTGAWSYGVGVSASGFFTEGSRIWMRSSDMQIYKTQY